MAPRAVLVTAENVPVVVYAVDPFAVTFRSAADANGQSCAVPCRLVCPVPVVYESEKLATVRALLVPPTPPTTASRCTFPAAGVSAPVTYVVEAAEVCTSDAGVSHVEPADSSQQNHAPDPLEQVNVSDVSAAPALS